MKNKLKNLCTATFFSLFFLSCSSTKEETSANKSGLVNEVYETTGSIYRNNQEIDRFLAENAAIEVLAEGFTWAEGPLWLTDHNMLIFSDVPNNKVYSWQPGKGLDVYLSPSGFTGSDPTVSREPGANGLILDASGNLVLCQHGDRRVARMDAPLDAPKAKFVTLASTYQGKRFDSPNDAVLHPSGAIYFTDPPYGLKKMAEDPAKEIPFQGVYKIAPDGEVTLLTDILTRPNGIALTPDGNTLYVANSDRARPIIMAFDIQPDGLLTNERIFFDASALQETGAKGSMDGLKVHPSGYVFATGPGGVLILSPDGGHLGTVQTGQPTANCAFNNDFSYLYMTANNFLMRVSLLPPN